MRTALTAVLLLAGAAPLAAQQPPGKLEPPAVRFQGVSPAGQAVFEVTNPNAAPLHFIGYATTKNGNVGVVDGKISPLYALDLRRGDAWTNTGLGWCGTGMGPVTIPARA